MAPWFAIAALSSSTAGVAPARFGFALTSPSDSDGCADVVSSWGFCPHHKTYVSVRGDSRPQADLHFSSLLILPGVGV